MTPLEMVKYYSEVTKQKPNPSLYVDLISEEYLEWLDENSPQAELKELADLVYVIYGYASARGWNLDEALKRVHENNVERMYQDDGKILRREDGKIIKNPNTPEVNLEDLV